MIGSAPVAAEQSYGRGLEGLVVGDTAISSIDGERGRLVYRGYDVEVVAAQFADQHRHRPHQEAEDPGRYEDEERKNNTNLP